ncbi:MAG TPA: calcium-binding protein [Thermoanaerobaculia bacterium]|nr:calcium-binding protein [Thermoanaerobaculia bacterium]
MKPKPGQRHKIAAAELDELIEEATVDCYNESEQRTGFYTMLEENLGLPFETDVLGVPVTVERIDLTRAEEIVAICRRGRARQAIPILDLPLPVPAPRGAEWIEAYRRWVRGA